MSNELPRKDDAFPLGSLTDDETAIVKRQPKWAGKARRCTAHTTKGKPCQAPAIRGGFVCVAHGGRAPQVRAKAAEREANWQQLQDAAPVAIDRLRSAASSGKNEAAAVRAADSILDRTGYSHKREDDNEEGFRELLIRFREIKAQREQS